VPPLGVHGLGGILNPRRIALVGVSQDPRSVSGKLPGNPVVGGSAGVVYPVSPGVEATLGVGCCPDVAHLPRPADLAILCTPAAEVPGQVAACGEAGIGGVVIVTAGFRETGAEGRPLEAEIRAAQARLPGMRIIGPSCLGIIVPRLNLNASSAGAMPRPGSIAFLSQSGALCTSVPDRALGRRETAPRPARSPCRRRRPWRRRSCRPP
jgi:acetyltransferase